MGREVDLVDDQQIGFGDARAALARNFIAGGDVDHVERKVGKLGAEGCREIVAATLDQNDVESGKASIHFRHRRQIHRRILANGRVRATARFHTDNAIGVERLVAQQKLGVLACVYVVGNRRHVVLVTQGFAQGDHQGCFAGADRATDTYSESGLFHCLSEPGRKLEAH